MSDNPFSVNRSKQTISIGQGYNIKVPSCSKPQLISATNRLIAAAVKIEDKSRVCEVLDTTNGYVGFDKCLNLIDFYGFEVMYNIIIKGQEFKCRHRTEKQYKLIELSKKCNTGTYVELKSNLKVVCKDGVIRILKFKTTNTHHQGSVVMSWILEQLGEIDAVIEQVEAQVLMNL